MKQIIVAIVVGLCIFAAFGTTYIFISYLKDQERSEMEAMYELDIFRVNEQIDNLTAQLYQYLGDENMLIGTWTRFLGNGSIFFDTIYIYSNKTAGLYYTDSALWNVSYTIENGILLFVGGTAVRDFSYCFFDENTLVVSNPYPGWSVDPKAVYIRS